MAATFDPTTSSMTRKGQVTIPADIRRLLRLSAGDKVAFRVHEGKVEIAPAESVVARTAGMLKSKIPMVGLAQEKRDAEEEMARQADRPPA